MTQNKALSDRLNKIAAMKPEQFNSFCSKIDQEIKKVNRKMTPQQYNQKYREINAEILRLEDLREQLKRELQSSAPFPAGSKVKLQDSDDWFYVIKVNLSMNQQSFSYDLTRPKKDGGMPSKVIDAKYYISQNQLSFL